LKYRPQTINRKKDDVSEMKSILVTGGTGGLGTAVVQRLMNEGYRCVIPYHTRDSAQRLINKIPLQQQDRIAFFEADLLTETSVKLLFSSADERSDLFGVIHLVGGIRTFRTISDTTLEDWESLLNLNLLSFFLIARDAMKIFQQRKEGRIISVAAMAAIKPGANHGAYGVAKAGVIALTKILADEGRTNGITANCIAPGIIRTEANERWGSEEEQQTWVSTEEIAGTVTYLLRPEAASVNGSILQLFGGLNL